MILNYFNKRFSILLIVSLSLIHGLDCSQHQFALASLYHQKLSAKQKQWVGGAAFGVLTLIAAIAYFRNKNNNNKSTKSTVLQKKEPKTSKKSTTAENKKNTPYQRQKPTKPGADYLFDLFQEDSNKPNGQKNDKKSSKDSGSGTDENITEKKDNPLTIDTDGYDQDLKANSLLIAQVQKDAENFYGDYYGNITSLESHKVPWTQKIIESFTHASVLVPEEVHSLIINFIRFKKERGTSVETNFYAKNFSYQDEKEMVKDFIKRLLTKRPLVFYGLQDGCILDGNGALENRSTAFKNLTNDAQCIQHLITYDEMQISALLGLWTPSALPFNNGSRDNFGKSCDKQFYAKPVGFAGLVGARFEVPNFMEWQHIIVTKEQNTTEHGYGPIEIEGIKTGNITVSVDNVTWPISLLQIWAKFYNIKYFPLFDDVKEKLQMQEKVIDDSTINDEGKEISRSELSIWHSEQKINTILSENEFIPMFNYNMTQYLFFNVLIYKKRMAIIINNYIDTLLNDHKTIHPDQKVLFYMPGFGTGAWGSIKINNLEYRMIHPSNESNEFFNTNLLLQCLQIDIYIDLINNVYKDNDQIYGFELGFFGFGSDVNKNYDFFCKHSLLSNIQYVDKENYQSRIFTYDTKKLIINQRNPFNLLSHLPAEEAENLYLETSFAWDSNAPVGNEGAKKELQAHSGDPAAACSIQCGYYVLNPAINPYILKNIAGVQ